MANILSIHPNIPMLLPEYITILYYLNVVISQSFDSIVKFQE